jgi:putative ABC transport system permease protein
MSTYITLGYGDVALASVFVLINAALSVALELGIHRRMLIAAVRMVVQLSLMGLVLIALFSVVSPLFTGLAALGMALFAGREIAARQERPLAGPWSYGLGTVTITTASMLVTIFALTVSLRPDPWYDPRYAIPLLGMILGNAMSGISLGIHGMTTGLTTRRAAVEAQLMLGADRRTAFGPVVRQSLRSALMPIVNSMSATGIVSLPGMMTGQILGGVAPADAVKYQLLIMFLIAGATGLGVTAAVLGCAWRLTDSRHRLRLDRLSPAKTER